MAAMNQFIRGRRVLNVERRLIEEGRSSFWSFCVEYLDGQVTEPRPVSKVDYKEVLTPPQFERFARLRALRKEFSDREAVPPYAVFTNEQLARMVRLEATSDQGRMAQGTEPAVVPSAEALGPSWRNATQGRPVLVGERDAAEPSGRSDLCERREATEGNKENEGSELPLFPSFPSVASSPSGCSVRRRELPAFTTEGNKEHEGPELPLFPSFPAVASPSGCLVPRREHPELTTDYSDHTDAPRRLVFSEHPCYPWSPRSGGRNQGVKQNHDASGRGGCVSVVGKRCPRFLSRVLGVLLASLCFLGPGSWLDLFAPTAHAGDPETWVVSVESELFTIDTRDRPSPVLSPAFFVVVAESPLFTIDTRDRPSPVLSPAFFVVVAESPLFMVNTIDLRPAWAFESSQFRIDTRGTVTGTLAGRVVSGGNPVAGAIVELEPAGLRALTSSDGRFALSGVPAASGYVLTVSAPGFATATRDGINVGGGATDVGELRLTALGGALRLVALDPDVNPARSSVEEGGTVYRYYRVVGPGGEPAGGVKVDLRRSDGVVVPQSEQRPHDWTGQVAGVSDADGIVRLLVPAAAVGSGVGAAASFDVLVAGQSAARFEAQVASREYSHLWRHRVGGGLSGKVAGLRAGASGAYETEVEQDIVGGQARQESITRRRESEVRAGVELGAGVKIIAKAEAKIGAGGFLAADLYSAYAFDPATTAGTENLMKVYVATADTLLLMTGPLRFLADYVRERVEPGFLGTHLEATGGELRLGGYAEGGFSLGFKAGKQVRIGAGAELSGEIAGLFGYESRYGEEPASVRSLGLVRSASVDVGAGLSLGPKKRATDLNLDLFSLGGENEFRADYISFEKPGKAAQVQVSQRAGLEAGIPAPLAVIWSGSVSPGLQNEARLELTERLQFSLPDAGALSRLNAGAPFWGILSGLGQGGVLREGDHTALVASFLATAVNEGTPVDYERTVAAADVGSLGLGVELDLGVLGLGVDLEGEIERGAQAVWERGRIWRYRRMGLESYPPLSAEMLPQRSILELESAWVQRAAGAIKEAFKELITRVASVGETVIESVTDAGKAVLTVGQGLMQGDAEIVSRWFLPGNRSGGRLVSLHAPGPDDGFLPPPDAANYLYGIGGIYQYASAASLTGPATLSLSYLDGDVAGLDEAALRIYQLADDGRHWRLLGGEVNTNLNTVTTTVTNLGTFALAPPMPAGNLVLRLGGNSLPADGRALMSIAITNLLLNTGAPATGPWLFTAASSGVDVVDADARPSLARVQVVATNSTLTFTVRAPVGGSAGRVVVSSVAGDAVGEVTIPLVDDSPPGAPQGVSAAAGQSRVWVSWAPNVEADVAAYRIHYRADQPGPPWNGRAAVEGSPSPVAVSGTNAVLRGLEVSRTYFLAVAAVDSTGNESTLSSPVQVTTRPGPPQPPTGVVFRFLQDGTAQLMWSLSEDDGFNDRDVVRYEVWRAILPGGTWEKARELPMGSEVFLEPAPAVGAGQFLRYFVIAMDRDGNSSERALSSRYLADGHSVDNDGDGMPDDWETAYGLDPNDPADAAGDADGDGVSNLAEYLAGTAPSPGPAPRFESVGLLADGRFEGRLIGAVGRTYSVEVSEDLSHWSVLADFPGTNTVMVFVDPGSTNAPHRYYRAVSPSR